MQKAIQFSQCPSALSSLVRLIGPRASGHDYRWPIVRAGLGLVCNLALEPASRAQLKREGLLAQLPSHLELVGHACGLRSGGPRREGSSLGGVAAEDLLESLFLGLLVLAKDERDARLWLLGLTPSAPGLDTPAELAVRVLGIEVGSGH